MRTPPVYDTLVYTGCVALLAAAPDIAMGAFPGPDLEAKDGNTDNRFYSVGVHREPYKLVYAIVLYY